MVLTRTQTGAMATKTYSPLILSRMPQPSSPSLRKNGPQKPTKILKPGRIKRSPLKLRREKLPLSPASQKQTPAPKGRKSSLLKETVPSHKSSPISPRKVRFEATRRKKENESNMKQNFGPDLCEGNYFFPSVCIGERQTVGLSKVGHADKDVAMWEKILEEHQREFPSLAASVEEQLMKAKERRATIDDTIEENLRVG